MRKMGDLMKDLGFNEEASLNVKTAFVRHLMNAANELSPQKLTPISKQSLHTSPKVVEEVQLSFDPELLKAK